MVLTAPERGSWWPWCIFAGVLIAFPLLVRNPYYLNVVNIIGLNAIIVLGLNLLIGYAGQISLGHAAFYGLGAYISGILSVSFQLSPLWAMLCAVVMTALVALLIGIPTLKLRGHYLVMATLGFNLIVNIIIVQWDSVTGGPSGLVGIPPLRVGDLLIDTDMRMYMLISSVVLVSMILASNLVNSRPGRGLRALHSGETAANCLGINTQKYKIKVFVLSAVYAALAGSLYAHYNTFISPKTFDIFFSVELVSMVIVGGMASVWGVFFGVAFLTSLPNSLHFFDEYKDVFYGLILVTILIYMPEGLFAGLRNRLVKRFVKPKPSHTNVVPMKPRPRKRNGSGAAPMLTVRDVSMNFGGLMALADISFDVPGESITAIIGPNGAGKTTLFNVISGLHSPRTGSIFFKDTDVSRLPPYHLRRRGLSRTFQNIQVFQEMTTLENVMVGMHGVTTSEFACAMFLLPESRREERYILERSWQLLDFFDLTDYAYAPAGELPYGRQKLLEMARALAPDPDLLLLDEPVAGLNITESQQMADYICKTKAMGTGVLLVEHDMNLVMSISDNIIVLNYGRKIAEGSVEHIQSNPLVLSAYLGGVA